MKGPGKYDALSDGVLYALGANGVLVIVLDGPKGSGFAMSLRETILGKARALLPSILREVATEIEKDLAPAAADMQ